MVGWQYKPSTASWAQSAAAPPGCAIGPATSRSSILLVCGTSRTLMIGSKLSKNCGWAVRIAAQRMRNAWRVKPLPMSTPNAGFGGGAAGCGSILVAAGGGTDAGAGGISVGATVDADDKAVAATDGPSSTCRLAAASWVFFVVLPGGSSL